MADCAYLAYKAYRLRVDVIEATTAAGSGHPTSCLSAADIVSTLFFHAMRFDPADPDNANNDRFVLSKGHAAPLLYAAWHELGAVSHDELMRSRQFDSPLEGHPTRRFFATDVATGSLGIGLSAGLGIAYGAHMQKNPARIYVLLGDSELAEGSVWEAAEIAGYYAINNLVAIVDVNGLGQRGMTMDGHDLDRIARKFQAFGWTTMCVDGHDVKQLVKACDAAKTSTTPYAIIARTAKGYGVALAEDKNGWHGKALSPEQAQQAFVELKTRFWQPEFEKFAQRDAQQVPVQVRRTRSQPASINLPTLAYKVGQMVATRQACGDALCQLAEVSSRLVVLDAEVSNSTGTTAFAQKFPKKFIECFIAEQNMVGMASGLAARGFMPFAATFSAFLTRAYDQIRMAGVGQLPVRLVGSHAGVSIGYDGPSQMGLEDMGMIASVPDSIILYPADAVATQACVQLMANYEAGISYLRTARQESPVIYDAGTAFRIGGFHAVRSTDRDSAVIIAAGATLFEALAAYDQLKAQGIPVAVVDLYGVKPLDVPGLIAAAQKAGGRVVTVEDHCLAGGIGQRVAQTLSGYARVTCMAVTKLMRSGSPQELRAYAGIDADAIVQAVTALLGK